MADAADLLVSAEAGGAQGVHTARVAGPVQIGAAEALAGGRRAALEPVGDLATGAAADGVAVGTMRGTALSWAAGEGGAGRDGPAGASPAGLRGEAGEASIALPDAGGGVGRALALQAGTGGPDAAGNGRVASGEGRDAEVVGGTDLTVLAEAVGTTAARASREAGLTDPRAAGAAAVTEASGGTRTTRCAKGAVAIDAAFGEAREPLVTLTTRSAKGSTRAARGAVRAFAAAAAIADRVDLAGFVVAGALEPAIATRLAGSFAAYGVAETRGFVVAVAADGALARGNIGGVRDGVGGRVWERVVVAVRVVVRIVRVGVTRVGPVGVGHHIGDVAWNDDRRIVDVIDHFGRCRVATAAERGPQRQGHRGRDGTAGAGWCVRAGGLRAQSDGDHGASVKSV